MVAGPRIVFLIDRYQGENQDCLKKVVANINLSCLRILCYYKHSFCARGVKSSILWGYKFFDSAKQKGASHHYKQCKFLEYTTSTFDKFENELYDGICWENTASLEQNEKPGEKLKVALTEIITDFQWDRPELFSPGKSWWKNNESIEIENNNLLFLFTNCPSGLYNPSTYFEKCYQNHTSFIECLFPNVLFKKFVKHLKIKLCWIDTGICISNTQFNENDHTTMVEGLRSVNGCFLEMRYLASWWIYSANNEINYKDVINVSSLVRQLLNDSLEVRDIYISRHSLSLDNNCKNSILSLSPIHPGSITQSECEEKSKTIIITEVVDLKNISLNTLNNKLGYFYVVNPMLSESNKNLMVKLNENCFCGKAIKIKFSSMNTSELSDALMIPCTAFFGTIIPLFVQKTDEVSSAKTSSEKGVFIDDITEEMKLQLRKSFSAIKQDFGTSLVNSVDTWFLSNPRLGCSVEIKNILCNVSSDWITMQKKRDGNSKLLVEHMKETYTKLKLNSQNKRQCKKILEEKTLGKQRLKNHRKKLKDDQIDTSINENVEKLKTENTVNSSFVEPFIKIPTKENLNDIVSSEYEAMLEKTLSPSGIRNIIRVVIQCYKTADSDDSYKESSISFLNSTILSNVEDIRDKNVNIPKDELVKEYLLQVHLYFECVHQLDPPNTETILTKVISLLRTVSFEESAAYTSKHMNEVVLPRYPDMTEFLREIYENLMIDFPDELDESRDIDEVSIKSVDSSSIKSYCSSEYSPLSIQAGKRTVRRIPSIVGDNANKKVIAVQVKKTNKDKLKQKKSVSEDKVVKRTLFTQQPPTSNVLATPKPKRRYSESVVKKRVPDTPETKQINDMIWKKLERKRRYSNIDKKMVSIEESPLKEIASPIKRHSSFYRSSSFNCHTSPRRFYKMNRHPSMIVGSHGYSQSAFEEVKSNIKPGNETVSASPIEVKLRRRSTLFSNFDGDEDDMSLGENQVVPMNNEENEEDSISVLPLFENENTPVKLKERNNSCKIDCHISKRLKLSSPDSEMKVSHENKFFGRGFKNKRLTRFNSELNSVIEDLDTERPVFMTETTVDWLTAIEKDQSNTPTNFHDAFAKLSNTPVNIQSPAMIKAGDESISVSPCLSASSLELLEKAPIISPVITKKKKCKGRLFNVEYD